MGSLWTYDDIALHFGLRSDIVRVYRKFGLLPPPDRVEGGMPYWDSNSAVHFIFRRPRTCAAEEAGLRRSRL
ncbi:hypothetical protein AMK31_36970 [Streptomyces sp. TSRI0107]|nr:hypothetical protein [Streptomyces sp. TSRI0107]OKJ70203.1 hypothetical protein AMK31_36970 [Streptomyces sp. TSRI0107]